MSNLIRNKLKFAYNNYYKLVNSSNTANYKVRNNVIGDDRHFTPAIKEWPSSAYFYDKNIIKQLPIKEKQLDKIIKNYCNLLSFYTLKNVPKRKQSWFIRKDTQIRRKSINKSILSKSEFKYNADKIVINVFILDTLKRSIKKRMSTVKKYLLLINKSILQKTNSNNIAKNSYSETMFNSSLKKNFLYLTYLRGLLSNTLNINTIKHKYNKLSHINSENKNLNYIYKKKLVLSIKNKKSVLKNIFLFFFYKWVLQLFKIKISLNSYRFIVKFVINNRTYSFKKHNFLKYLKMINNFLIQLLIYNVNQLNIATLFEYFKNKYYNKFLSIHLKKELLALHYMYTESINKNKFESFILGLKVLTSKLFNKKVEFNFVNLKYLHLNSDIYSEAVAKKLMRKRSSVFMVMRRSLKLAKIPYKTYNKNTTLKSNGEPSINRHKLFKLNNLSYNLINNKENGRRIYFSGDFLQAVLYKIYGITSSNLYNYSTLNEEKQRVILNSIKYKWIKGVKIELKGRLTKRFTASRSLFKYQYKGNLKNIDTNYGLSSIMLRGDNKPNMQHSFYRGYKRIGVFGVKSWISTK